MDNELDNMSDEQLQQLLAQSQQQESSPVADSVPNNMAIAASQGLAAGLQKASTAPGLLLRDFTDKLGFTDPNVTNAQRQANADMESRAKQAGIELNAPGSAAIGQLLGEVAPTFALGGAALSGGKALLGAGRAADIGANILSGAVTSGIQDQGGDLAKNADSAIQGGLLGGTIAGVAQGAGKLLQGKFGGDLDTQAMQAFDKAGIKPRASQVIKQAGTDHAQRGWEGIENTLNKFPLIGTRGFTKTAGNKGADIITKTVDELDGSVPQVGQQFNTFINSMDNAKGYNLGNVQRTVQNSIDSIANTKGVKANQEVQQYLLKLKDDFSTPTNFRDLVKARQGIDGAIDSIRKNLSNPASRDDFAALAKIRGRVSTALDAIARQNGTARTWTKANQAYQDRLFMDGIVNAKNAATKDGGRTFNIKTFSNQLDNEMAFMQNDMKLQVPTLQKRGVENLKKIVNIVSSDKVKPGSPGLSPMMTAMMGGAVGTGVAVGGLASLPAMVAAGLAVKGLSLMATTKFGIERIARLGKITPHNPNVRQLIGAALAIGHADDSRSNEVQSQQELDNMSDEQLQQLLQQQGGQ